MFSRGRHAAPRQKGKELRRFGRAIPLALAFVLTIGAAAALASTTLDSGDVAVVGTASVSPGASLVRAGGSATFNLTVTADDGNIPDSQCDGTKNKVTVPTSFTVTSTGLVAGATTTSQEFPCHNYSGSGGSPETLTFSGLTVSAAADAPLGLSNHAITFGASGAMVTLGNQVVLSTSPAFVAPRLFVSVSPRPASALSASAVSTSQIDVSWTASPDSGAISGYVISQTGGSSESLSAAAAATSLSVMDLDPSTEYCFTIVARYTDDASNNFDSSVEPVSGAICATTLDPTPTSDLGIAGFKSPVDMGITNTAKGGQTIPLKFEIFDGTTEVENNTSLVTVFTQSYSCGAVSPITDAIENYTTGSTSLRWDATSGQYIFNWKTPKVNSDTCYRVTLTIGDGSSSDTITADFLLRK